MTDISDRVLGESQRFYQALPELLGEYRDRWVVFRDGHVQSNHPSEEQAYEAGVARYGVSGAFVVALVAEVTPTPLTAAVAFE